MLQYKKHEVALEIERMSVLKVGVMLASERCLLNDLKRNIKRSNYDDLINKQRR